MTSACLFLAFSSPMSSTSSPSPSTSTLLLVLLPLFPSPPLLPFLLSLQFRHPPASSTLPLLPPFSLLFSPPVFYCVLSNSHYYYLDLVIMTSQTTMETVEAVGPTVMVIKMERVIVIAHLNSSLPNGCDSRMLKSSSISTFYLRASSVDVPSHFIIETIFAMFFSWVTLLLLTYLVNLPWCTVTITLLMW